MSDKAAIYFEDMHKRIFIIKVYDPDLEDCFLEKRRWRDLDRDDYYNYHLEFDKYRSFGNSDQKTEVECYKWISDRSHIEGIGRDTKRYSDRCFIDVNSPQVKATRALIDWLLEVHRKKAGQPVQIPSCKQQINSDNKTILRSRLSWPNLLVTE